MRKRLVVIALAGMFLVIGAAPSMAMDRFDQVWLRDTLVGTGVGLGVGVVSQNTGFWVLAGLVAGGLFGYLDAKDHLVLNDDPPSPWAPEPRITVESRPIDGRERPEQILKATLYQVRW